MLLSKIKENAGVICYFLANKKYQTLALLVPALLFVGQFFSDV